MRVVIGGRFCVVKLCGCRLVLSVIWLLVLVWIVSSGCWWCWCWLVCVG